MFKLKDKNNTLYVLYFSLLLGLLDTCAAPLVARGTYEEFSLPYIQRIADVLECPVINAGDGTHEHPTQASGFRMDLEHGIS